MSRYGDPVQIKVGCTLKVRYASFAEADAARWALEAQEEYPFFVYVCGHCAGWHLTKNEPGLSPQRIRRYRHKRRLAMQEAAR